jgi:hypothetical protein
MLSKSARNRLGERIAKSAEPSPDDVRQLLEMEQDYSRVLDRVLALVEPAVLRTS